MIGLRMCFRDVGLTETGFYKTEYTHIYITDTTYLGVIITRADNAESHRS